MDVMKGSIYFLCAVLIVVFTVIGVLAYKEQTQAMEASQGHIIFPSEYVVYTIVSVTVETESQETNEQIVKNVQRFLGVIPIKIERIK